MKLTKTFFDDIRSLILSARVTVARGVDLVQVHTNFEIGRRIVEHEQQGKHRAAYGKEVLKDLAQHLTKEFGPGFSKRNLELMRRFYSFYASRVPAIAQTVSAQLPAPKKTQTPSAQLTKLPLTPQKPPFSLSWSHYVFLLGIDNPDERSFYEIESSDWTVRELRRQFDSSLYERLALSRDKKGIRALAKKGQLVKKPQDIFQELFLELWQSQLKVAPCFLVKPPDQTFSLGGS